MLDKVELSKSAVVNKEPEKVEASKKDSAEKNRSITESPKKDPLKFVRPFTNEFSVVLPRISDSILKEYLQEKEQKEDEEQIPPLEKIPADELEYENVSSSVKTLPVCHKYGSPVIDKTGRIIIHMNSRQLVNIYQCSHLHTIKL